MPLGIIEKSLMECLFTKEELEKMGYPNQEKQEESSMKVTYNGFAGELVKLERVSRDRAGVPMGMKFGGLPFDLSIYDCEKNVTHSFAGVKLEDVKFLGGAVAFGG